MFFGNCFNYGYEGWAAINYNILIEFGRTFEGIKFI